MKSILRRRAIAETPPETRSPEQEAQHQRALGLLRAMIGNDDAEFRDDQWPVIDALVNRHEKVLLVQRTGWGKSAVYFITAKLLRDQGNGPTLIVSPLIALMRNQVMAGRRMGLRIGALHAGTNDRFDTFVELLQNDAIDVLLVSPERFANERFVNDMLPAIRSRTGLLVVDEAHCISDWGHDFRPDYQRLASLMRELPPESPLLATTATANDRVVQDIHEQLGNISISRGALIRENLGLQTLPRMSATERFAWLAQTVPDLPGKGIVYTLTRQDAERVASWLQLQGVDAQAYHSDVVTRDHADAAEAKKALEEAFTTGDLRVLVATNALGMGYDNPDIRFVIHYQSPPSIIAYYQQAGRAGRGVHGATGVLMSGPEDAGIHENFRTSSLPTAADVMEIMNALGEKGATVTQLMGKANIPKSRLQGALRFLSVQEPPPIVKERKTWKRTSARLRPDHVERRDALIALREAEWEEMETYRRLRNDCRMHFLLTALDDPDPPATCGRCEVCLGEPILIAELDPDLMRAANQHLRRTRDETISPRLQIPKGAMPIYNAPYRIPENLRAESGLYMGRYGDGGIGDDVRMSKNRGVLSDHLVDLAVEFLEQRWTPATKPEWVTWAPSRRHQDMAPDFARKLAGALGLPAYEAIVKVGETAPQKDMSNSYYQCRNLDGAFELAGTPPSGRVLLVDDFVDSGWTFTILAMLLRKAGSGPVLPFALATTRPGT